MDDQVQHPKLFHNIARHTSLSMYQQRLFRYYTNPAFQCSVIQACGATMADFSTIATTTSHVFVAASAEKGNFVVDFLMGGVSTAVSKTVAYPIEQINLWI
ncbi:hypothetical protein RYX36_008861 [Vicia faba]